MYKIADSDGLGQARCPVHDLPLTGPSGACPVAQARNWLQGQDADVRDVIQALKRKRRRHNWIAFGEAMAVLGGIGLAMWIWMWLAAAGGPQ